jgi:hypothetical protein
LGLERVYDCTALGEYVRVKAIVRTDVSNMVAATDHRRRDGQLALEQSARSLVEESHGRLPGSGQPLTNQSRDAHRS